MIPMGLVLFSPRPSVRSLEHKRCEQLVGDTTRSTGPKPHGTPVAVVARVPQSPAHSHTGA